MPPSFREKTAWTCLATTVAVYVPYFAHVYRLFDRGEAGPGAILGAFVAATAAQVILAVAATVAIAVASGRPERKDERDAAIEARAARIAYVTLAASGFVAVGAALAASSATAGRFEGAAYLAQVVLLCFVVAEVTRYAAQVASYRRGG